jgi:FixJ family two-component response regulator
MEHEPLIVVVDDDARICRAIERVLINGGYHHVRTFPSARHYLAEQSWLEPDCLIIDVRLSDIDGIAMLIESRAAGLETPAIFITGSADVATAVEAMKLGAIDLLEKPLDERTLLASVDHALHVGYEVRLARQRLAALWQALATFTPREAQVCALVASGRLNKQIAAIIGTTEKTVKVHRARAMAKLGAHSLAELVRAVDELLDPHQPTCLVSSDHTVLHSPPGLVVMRAALAHLDEPGTRLTDHTESIRARSRESFDSVGHPHEISAAAARPDA